MRVCRQEIWGCRDLRVIGLQAMGLRTLAWPKQNAGKALCEWSLLQACRFSVQDCRFLAHSTPMAQGSLGLQLKFESSAAQGGRAAGLLHGLIELEIAEANAGAMASK